MWSAWILETVRNILNDIGVKNDLMVQIESKIYETIGFDKENETCYGDGEFACGTMEGLAEMTKNVIRKMYPKVDDETVNNIFKKRWTTPDPVALAFQRADLKSLFTSLKKDFGLKVCVCTTDDKDPTDKTLRAFQVDKIVDVRLGGDMGIAPKPSKDQIEYLCSKMGGKIKPCECVMVGDTPRDMQMALNAGCALGIAVLGGASGRKDLKKATHIVDGLNDVLDVLNFYI
tara:strand:- start:1441 stop:2133 length:693 start_codon:yes stop_codon:yes gene_type:complete